jgi:thermitase
MNVRLVAAINLMSLAVASMINIADAALPGDTLRTDTGEIIIVPDPGICGVDYADSQFIASFLPGYLTLPGGQTEAPLDSCSVDSTLKPILQSHYVDYVRQVFTGAQLYDTLRIVQSKSVTVPDLSQIYILHQQASCDVLDAMEDLYDHQATRYAEPCFFGTLLAVPNDQLWSSQWNLKDEYPGIGCPTAWDVTQGESAVRLGIIDTGVDYDHPDLGGPGFPNDKIAGGYDYGEDPDPDGPLDVEGHGIMVAGIAGAFTNNNEIGVAGIAGGWNLDPTGVDIYAFKYKGSAGYAEKKARAMWHAADPGGNYGCHIINCSWILNNTDLISQPLLYAYRANVNVVAGKRNEASQRGLPADFHYRNWVIGVGGYGTDGKYCDLDDCAPGYASGRGRGLDLVAPAMEIPTTDLDGLYFDFARNSAATPHVSGAVSLLRSSTSNWGIPFELNNEDYEWILKFSAYDPTPEQSDDLSDGNEWTKNDYYGHGQLRISTAIDRLTDHDWSLTEHSATGAFYRSNPPETYTFHSPTSPSDIPGGYLEGDYLVERYDVYVDVNYPSVYSEVPYVWGIGHGTAGWSAALPNYQVGWCQLVDDSQSIGGCQLMTFVYKVYNAEPGQIWSWYPCPPWDVELQYRL